MKNRFIDSHYKTLFSIDDGGEIIIVYADGVATKFPVVGIDETHFKIGYNVYHICEFAEKMERSGHKYYPMPDVPYDDYLLDCMKNSDIRSDEYREENEDIIGWKFEKEVGGCIADLENAGHVISEELAALILSDAKRILFEYWNIEI